MSSEFTEQWMRIAGARVSRELTERYRQQERAAEMQFAAQRIALRHLDTWIDEKIKADRERLIDEARD